MNYIYKTLFIFLFTTFTLFSKTTKIEIVSFNDFHGNVAEDTREKGKNIGMAKMVGYINSLKKLNPNTIVVSGGDNYQGTAISNLTFGAPVTKMMKAMDVKASAIGNHEFDWGSQRITNWAKDGNFDYLAANIYDKTTHKPVTWAKPYKFVNVNTIKIAFIGLSTKETKYQTKIEFVKNLEFKDASKAATYWVKYLNSGKAKEGKPDVIIALTHIPSSQDEKTQAILGEELSNLSKVNGIDAIITGHSHKTVSGFLNKKPIIQAYKYGRALGRLSLTLKNNKVVEIKPFVDMVSENKSDIISDENMNTILEKQNHELSSILNEKLGYISHDIPHDRNGGLSPLGYWFADVMRKKANAQIGLTNGGGVRRPLYKGDITMKDMYEIMPFDNQIVVVKVTGKHLKALIDHGIEADYMGDGQFAGLNVIYDPKKPYEHRVVSMTLEDGTPINDNDIYTVATNDLLVDGGDKYDFSNAIENKNLFILIRDALVENVKKNKTIKLADPTLYLKEKQKMAS